MMDIEKREQAKPATVILLSDLIIICIIQTIRKYRAREKKHKKIAHMAQILSGVDLRLRGITILIILSIKIRYPNFKLRIFSKTEKYYVNPLKNTPQI